jgi:hypothetical protein
MSFTHLVDRVIQLAQAWRRAVPQPKGLVRLSDLPPPPPCAEREELRRLLQQQPVAVLYLLLVLMYLGRGDLDDDRSILDYYVQMSNTFARPHAAVSQLMGKVPLPRYLINGLARVAERGIDLDRWLDGGTDGS